MNQFIATGFTQRRAAWLIAFAFACASPLSAADFYVAPAGSDAGPGSQDKPFATLQRARDAARQSSGERRIVVCAGCYYLREPLKLGPQDSGLVIEGAKGELVVISGGRTVEPWRPWRGNVLQADLGSLDLPDCGFRELYDGGQRRPLARVPNFDPQHPRIGGVLFNARMVEADTKTKFAYRPGELQPEKWTHPQRALVVFHDSLNYEQTWSALKAVDPANHVVEAARGVYVLAPGCPYYLCGLLEELDSPGEWYVDPDSKTLYFWPPAGNPQPGQIIVPALESLLALEGDAKAGKLIEGVRIANLALRECRGRAVFLKGARNCTVAACELRNVGVGVYLGDDTHACRVAGCDITQTLGDGVSIIGTSADHQRVSEHTVDNNYIWDFGWGHIHNRCGGVYMHRCSHCRVTHNHIHDGPRYAIGMDVGNDCEIAYNYGHHVNLTTCDTSIIEAATALDWGLPIEEQLERNRRANGGNVIHHNMLHDSGGYGKSPAGKFVFPIFSWGIYLDLACSGWTVRDNLVWNTVLGGFMLNAGVDNAVENNIFADGKRNQVQFNPWSKYPMSGHRCRHNIIACDGGAASLYTVREFSTSMCRFSENLVHCRSGSPRIADIPHGSVRENWNEWLAMGQDQGSLLADPQFVDAANRDYRLKPDSPAAKIGFQPIDLSGVGNYESPERRTWPRPEMKVQREPADYRPEESLAPQQPPRRDYEDYAVGEAERAVASAGPVAVSEETASSGRRSLKFADAAGLKASYMPYVTYPLDLADGRLRAGFDLRIERGALFIYEWRDDPYTYNLGPRLSTDADGWLEAGGKRLVQLPPSQWVRIDVDCGLGRLAGGTYDLTVRLPGAEPHRYSGVACSPQFKTLNCVVVMSLADSPTVFYLDNVEFRPERISTDLPKR
ncbi:MAG: right-handed parallel beta-helix repeat-containing protein [Pirellulales bacterium]|nr:right-handed parallel beta-helix repeat-containing protein [Pirellulales bacterium]